MSEVNVPLLRKAVEWVEEQDKLDESRRQWFQHVYVMDEDTRIERYEHQRGCGTAYCVAGYVGTLVDGSFANKQWNQDLDHVSVVARAALGLSVFDARDLFHTDNTAQDVRRIAERIAGEKL